MSDALTSVGAITNAIQHHLHRLYDAFNAQESRRREAYQQVLINWALRRYGARRLPGSKLSAWVEDDHVVRVGEMRLRRPVKRQSANGRMVTIVLEEWRRKDFLLPISMVKHYRGRKVRYHYNDNDIAIEAVALASRRLSAEKLTLAIRATAETIFRTCNRSAPPPLSTEVNPEDDA